MYWEEISPLEGGVAGVATASGMECYILAIANVPESGDNIVVAKQVYGGTTLLHLTQLKDLELRLDILI